MNTHIAAGVSGLPLAQAKGPEMERAEQELAVRLREAHYERRAASAAGVGRPDGEEHQSDDRDADGRQPWDGETDSQYKPPARRPRSSKDPSGQSVGMLDVTG
jgi:hypothetical protein